MASNNPFDNGESLSQKTKSTVPVLITPSKERDRVISGISKISDIDLETLNSYIDRARNSSGGITVSNESEKLISFMRELDKNYSLTGDQSLLNNFPLIQRGTGFGNQDILRNTSIFDALQFHIGARRRSRTIQRTSGDYFTKVNQGLDRGDVAMMTNTRPCNKYNMSKSPYERFRKIWEDSRGNLVNIINLPNGDLKVDLSFLPPGTRERATELLRSSLTPSPVTVGDSITWQSGLFDRDILPDGATVPVDLGTENGSYLTNPSQDPPKTVGEVNERFNTLTFPREVFNLLENAADENGRLTDDENPKKIDESYKDLVFQYTADELIANVELFVTEYEKFKNLTPPEQERSILSEAKDVFSISYMSLLSILEIKKLDAGGVLTHSGHTYAMYQGYVEAAASLLKTIYYIYKGKYRKAAEQGATGITSAFAEFILPKIGKEVIGKIIGEQAASRLLSYGGYLGLILSTFQFYHDLVTVPTRKIREFNLINELLDLERREIEKECCTKIHPNLYRKTKGQFSVQIIGDGFIPVGENYNRSVQGSRDTTNSVSSELVNPDKNTTDPCINGNPPKKTTRKYIKVRSYMDKLLDDTLPENVYGPREKRTYITDPREETDPCNKKSSRIIEVRPDNNEDIGQIQYIEDQTSELATFWSTKQEEILEDATVQYNTSYCEDIYKHLIDSAKCRTGENPDSVTTTPTGTADRDGFFPLRDDLFGLSGGVYRVSIGTIDGGSSMAQTMDSSTATGRDWISIWDRAVNILSRGGGGNGTGLRGITSFGYDPLNPPKPRRQV
jgi:hypothetical protein